MMNFQGRLTDLSGNPLNGSYDMQLKLWDAASGGTVRWSETRLAANTQSVTVTNGLFSLKLGVGSTQTGSLTTAFSSYQNLYFEIQVGADTLGARSQVATSAYAFNSDTLDGLDSLAFGQLAGTNSWTGAQNVNVGSASAFQTKNGTTNLFNVDTTNSIITVGATDATGAVLVLDTKNTTGDPTGSSAVVGAMYYNSNAGKFRCYQNAGWADCITTVPTSTLQTAYAASTGGSTPEIKVSSGLGGVTIQDADTTIGGTLFSVTQPNASNLGTAIFNVSSTGAFSLGLAGAAQILSSDNAGVASLGISGQATTLAGNVSATGTFSNTGATAFFKPSSSATNAFQIQNSSSWALFSADTSANEVLIGSNSTSNTNQILLQLNSFNTFADTSTCATGTNQGGLYYNTKSNAVRGCINGGWEDMVSTASLGLQLFGVVPDSGAVPGDIYGVSSAIAGPCKVYVGSSTGFVAWNACTAFSGGRKVIVTAGSMAVNTNSVAGNFEHLCLTAANGQPTLSASGAETANLVANSFASSQTPILCLADIKFGAANSIITEVYDTRTYTTTDKTFVALNSAIGIGTIVIYSATKGTVASIGTANSNGIAGVIVAGTGAASSTAINAIMATGGPAAVKATAGTLNQYIFTSATAGYAVSATAKPTEGTGTIYNLLGNVRTAFSSVCAANSDTCQGSLMTDIDKR